jgi:hypothetical protein
MTSDELMQLLKAAFEYSMSLVHTSFPGTVVSYDPATRRADIQPSLKKRLPNGSFMEPAIIHDVPVRYQGSREYTVHFPLEEGDEVEVTVCERSTDSWRDTGGKGIEDADPRRFSLNDCYCTPGLQPVEFIAATEPGLQIIHKDKFDGKLISQVLMTDKLVEVLYKEKARVLVEDDHILGKTEKCSLEMSGDKIAAKNSKNTLELNDAISLITSGNGLVDVGNAMGNIGGILDDAFTALENLATEGSPAAHTAKTWAAAHITPLKTKSGQIFKK